MWIGGRRWMSWRGWTMLLDCRLVFWVVWWRVWMWVVVELYRLCYCCCCCCWIVMILWMTGGQDWGLCSWWVLLLFLMALLLENGYDWWGHVVDGLVRMHLMWGRWNCQLKLPWPRRTSWLMWLPLCYWVWPGAPNVILFVVSWSSVGWRKRMIMKHRNWKLAHLDYNINTITANN